jgi:hypothetical protein
VDFDGFLLIVILTSVFWVGLAVVVGLGADRRGMNGALWFGIAIVTTPLIAALLLLAVADARGPRLR